MKSCNIQSNLPQMLFSNFTSAFYNQKSLQKKMQHKQMEER